MKFEKARKLLRAVIRSATKYSYLPGEHRSAIHVQDFASNKTCKFCAQEENWNRDLFRRSSAPQWNSLQNAGANLRVIQSRSGHVSMNPSWGHAIDINPVARKLRREPFDHADECSLGRRIVTMKGFPALSSRRTYQDDLP